MKKRYTEAIHKERLIKVLEKKHTCIYCPAAPYLYGDRGPSLMWDTMEGIHPCDICTTFIGLKRIKRGYIGKCPCNVLGPEEAVKRSWIALEEKGYLDDQ